MNPNLQRGLLLYQQDRHDMAQAELRQALAAEPHNSYAHSLLALCLSEEEKYKEATEEAQQAIHLEPDSSFAHFAHARVLHDRNHFAEAQVALEEAIRLDSAEADYFCLLAGIYLQEQRWKESLAAAEAGLQLDPEHVGCTNLRAMALVKLGRRAEAGATIDAALAKNPENALTHANQGWTLLEKGDPRKALEHFREALRLDPENEWARRGIVEALKARHFIYALMLKYFFWMSRFSSRGQWGIILLGYFGNRLLGGISASNPSLAPWLLPLRILYVAFALMTWLAYPFFNLLLRLNRFGRLALSREQTVASNWFGLCLFLALASLAGWCWQGFKSTWLLAALVFGLLLLPVSAIFRCSVGWPRKTMTSITVTLAVAGCGALILLSGAIRPVSLTREASEGLGWGLFLVFVLGIPASTWVTNFLGTRRQRR
ncbi:MAG TPA: tetratricopeptide repeat protein [Verrucomicrobiae bacterium]|nr:tetratricopeptide repeat protein [Verrucomicrobiae bacterium]